MVYKRRKSTNWYTKKHCASAKDATGLAVKAWNGVKALQGIINSELKEVTVNQTLGFGTTGSVNLISGIGQGDTETGREGNSVLAKTLQMRLNPLWGSTTGPSLNRVIVFRDKQAIADTTPPLADLLESNVYGRIDHVTKQRFQIYYDRTFPMDSTNRQYMITKNFKVNQHLLFNGPLNSDTQKSPIYIATIGSQGDGTTGSVLTYDIKTNYYDN